MNNLLPTDYQSFIHKSRYARWVQDDGKRESWDETVERYIYNLIDHAVKDASITMELRDAILSCSIVRLLSL